MFQVLGLFWLFRTTKATLFYLYLWQLKEYHIGRFLDHFRTEKGKRLILNKLVAVKTFLVFFIFGGLFLPITEDSLFFEVFLVVPGLVLTLYIIESSRSLIQFFQKRLKKPVLTLKTIFLILATLTIEVLFLWLIFLRVKEKPEEVGPSWFTSSLLLFDILVPLIVSLVVLSFQPFVVLAKNQIIKRAKKKRRELENLLVIGITGSYGKTSTKEFLAEILSEKFKVLKTSKHQNSEMGVSQCVLNNLKKKHEVFVCEMAAYERGAIKLLTDIAKPKIGILTGINQQHQALFGSQQNIIKAKYELIESLPESGIAIFNGNNPHCLELYKKTSGCQKKIVSSKLKNLVPWDLKAEKIEVKKDSLFFEVVSKEGERVEFKLNLVGRQNIENILMATQAARELGMSLGEVSAACKKIRPQEKTMELKKGKGDLTVIDDSYAANPSGVIAALEHLNLWSQRKVLVMPCLIELGGDSGQIHRGLGEKIAQTADLAIITTKEYFQEIKEGATQNGMPEENVLFLENPDRIFEKIKSFCQPGGVVLLESRVPNKLIKLLVV